MKLATIVIAHHTEHDHLKNLLALLDNSLFDIVICSGNSCPHNYNKGAKIAETDKLIICNNDILPKNEDLVKMCEALNDFEFVGSTQICVRQKIKVYGIHIGKRQIYEPREQIRANAPAFPHGFCFGIRKDAWLRLGGYDERFLTECHSDVDFGIRAVQSGLSMRILDLEIKHVSDKPEDFKMRDSIFKDLYSQESLKDFALKMSQQEGR